MTLLRYWHTVRYLRPVQVYGRLLYKLRRPTPDLRPAPPLRHPQSPWHLPAWRQPSLSAPDSATFLNQTRDISHATAWSDADAPRLWLYNLHYFDDLTAVDGAARVQRHRAHVSRWIAENAPGQGPGWEPYPTSLRIVNWCKTWWSPGRAEALDPEAFHSLAVQTRWLAQRIEFHLQANHLWTNAKALVMAGLCFDGPEADAWRELGLGLMREQLDEQVLGDGGHYERSPMYHAIMLEDVLDLLHATQVHPGVISDDDVARLHAVAAPMLRWLRVMSHADHQVTFFNDSAHGVSAPYNVLAASAELAGVRVDETSLQPLEVLAESGYVRLEQGTAVVWCDVATVGPDHQPGHAHADTLSFELDVRGRRMLVNSGTSTYTPGALRTYQRSTPAHNTVTVDGQDSSEVWGGFRVARRARPHAVTWSSGPETVALTASHDGYQRLPGGVTHRRTWTLTPDRLVVEDVIAGQVRSAEATFLCAPGVRLGTDLMFAPDASARARIEDATWFPTFGGEVPTSRLSVSVVGGSATTEFRWS